MWSVVFLYVAASFGLLMARRGIAFSLIVGAAVIGWVLIGRLLFGSLA